MDAFSAGAAPAQRPQPAKTKGGRHVRTGSGHSFAGWLAGLGRPPRRCLPAAAQQQHSLLQQGGASAAAATPPAQRGRPMRCRLTAERKQAITSASSTCNREVGWCSARTLRGREAAREASVAKAPAGRITACLPVCEIRQPGRLDRVPQQREITGCTPPPLAPTVAVWPKCRAILWALLRRAPTCCALKCSDTASSSASLLAASCSDVGCRQGGGGGKGRCARHAACLAGPICQAALLLLLPLLEETASGCTTASCSQGHELLCAALFPIQPKLGHAKRQPPQQQAGGPRLTRL